MKKKTKLSTIDTSGMSIQFILELPYDYLLTLNRRELSALTSRLVSAANKRIRRLGSTEESRQSPSYKGYEKRGKMFSVKGKDTAKLREEFNNVARFLNAKTSSITKWKTFKTKTQQTFSERIYNSLNKQSRIKTSPKEIYNKINWKDFWNLYSALKDEYGMSLNGNSTRIQKKLFRLMSTYKNEDVILNKIRDYTEDMLFKKEVKQQNMEEKIINVLDLSSDT